MPRLPYKWHPLIPEWAEKHLKAMKVPRISVLARKLDVSRETIYQWSWVHPEFLVVLKEYFPGKFDYEEEPTS